ncbi:hypothetical protein AURDEDRAFT_161464 [Auricularia subglabra TFB-10046 SS5]|nr:hypothetical protein AURDEDRAFT_161464 [Auricularia subglabra TFB-10046 SS5]
MPVRFPDTVLPDVLDFLDLDMLLLAVMPVNRYWRGQTIEHPTYWRSIRLVGSEGYIEYHGLQTYLNNSQKHHESVDLFLLRLSRTYARPISISLLYVDPLIFGLLLPHMGHIRSLALHPFISHQDAVLRALRSRPAPLLESMELGFRYPHSEMEMGSATLLPCDMFSCHAPALKNVRLTDISLPTSELPPCFSNIRSLAVWAMHRNTQYSLPNVFQHCKQLRSLEICGFVALDDPEFRRAETWSSLARLSLRDLSPPNAWDILRILPLAEVPLISIYSGRNDVGVIALAATLGTRLSAAFPLLISSGDTDSNWCMLDLEPFGDTTPRRRIVESPLPRTRPAIPWSSPISAFENADFTRRIVELTLWLTNWELLVGQRYLTAFPSLQRLGLLLYEDPQWSPLSVPPTLSCPRLERVTLSARNVPPGITIAAAQFTEFVRAALPNAPFPIALEVVDVTLHGPLVGFEDIFSMKTADP